MIKYDLQYFEFIPSMWKYIYGPYGSLKIFCESANFSFDYAACFNFTIFAKQKLDENDKILTIFLSLPLLIILESISTIDQANSFLCEFVSVVFVNLF